MNTGTIIDLSWNLTQSPFASIIQTNYVPSTEELVHLEALLTEPQLQLAQLELEVARVQNLLDTLLLKRAHVKTYVEAHRMLMSPMRRLPEETLSEIFIRCLPEERYAVRSLAEAPLLLTTVSREWRRIALATPALWNSLHILLPSRLGSQALQRRTTSSTLWLDRAKSLPLSISIYVETPLRFHVNDNAPPSEDLLGGLSFLAALMKFTSRIKELIFTGTNVFDIATQLDSLSSLNFPILHTFRIRSAAGHFHRLQNGPDPDLPFASLVQQMPALKKLSVNSFSHHFNRYTQLQLDWKNLTELRIEPVISGHIVPNFSSREMLNMLLRTPQLQSLAFHVTITDWEPVDSNIVVNLPAMRNMRLVFMKQRDGVLDDLFFRNFFCSIVCPSLKVLNLVHRWGLHIMHTRIPFSPLLLFQEVEALLLDMPMTQDSLLEYLSLVPNLRSLEIGSAPTRIDGDESEGISPSFSHTVDDSVLLRLGTRNADGCTILPHLQHIRFIFKQRDFNTANTSLVDNHAQISDDALLTFLESHENLQSCDVFFPEPRAELIAEDLRRIHALLDSGLKLRIRYDKRMHSLKYNDSALGGLWLERAGLSTITPYGEVYSDMEGRNGTGVIV